MILVGGAGPPPGAADGDPAGAAIPGAAGRRAGNLGAGGQAGGGPAWSKTKSTTNIMTKLTPPHTERNVNDDTDDDGADTANAYVASLQMYGCISAHLRQPRAL